MSTSPMTPAKRSLDSNANSPQAQLSNDKLSVSIKAKVASVYEPSPASTYGETAGSSVPATPSGNIQPGTSGTVNHSLRAAQLDPAMKSMSGSPVALSEVKNRGSTSGRPTYVKFEDQISSPPKAGPMSDLPGSSPHSSSPSFQGHPLRLALSWRGSGEISLGKSTQQVDDPFVSHDQDSRVSPLTQLLTQHPAKVGLTPTNSTAQAIYSPQACVFVANLSQSESDEQLEHAVTESFQQFGNVYVKIRRDSRQMPFAFAQYTNVDDAQRAISLGRGMLVRGRPCRTEVARVNRSLYLSKMNGSTLAEAEAREVMASQGPIETIWSASQTEREMFGLPDGLFIRFAFFDDCRDAVAHFRDSDLYRLEQVKGLEESRVTPIRGVQRLSSPYHRDSPGRLVSPYSARRNTDIRSVFVGNIPAHLSEEQLAGMFGIYGKIINMEVIRKPSMVNTSGVNTFAFLEYEHPQSASVAVQAGSQNFQGLQLRIEHREPSHIGSRGAHTFGGSPRRNGAIDSPEFLAAFQRGVSVGIGQATQTLIPHPYYGPYSYYPAIEPGPPYGNGYMNPITAQYAYAPATTQLPQYDHNGTYMAPSSGVPQYHWQATAVYEDHGHSQIIPSHEIQ